MGSTAETTIIDSGIIEYAIFIVLLPMLAFPVIPVSYTHLRAHET